MTTGTTHTQTRPTYTTGAAPAGSLAASRARTVMLWILTAGAAAMFLMAGSAKLSGAPMMVQLFDTIGVGQWFRYLTGGIEVIGAVALFVPLVAPYAAAALAATMVGAIVTHVAIVGGSVAIPVALLAATAFIGWTRWSQR